MPPSESFRVLTFGNHKGGVGKSSTVAMTAQGISLMRKEAPALLPEAWRSGEILCIDMDPQANLTEILNVEVPDQGIIVEAFLAAPGRTRELALMGGVYGTRFKGVSLIPSGLALDVFSHKLQTDVGSSSRLHEVLTGMNDYRLVLVDTPPSIGILTQNAITAATHVVIPTVLNRYSYRGMTNFLAIMEKLEKLVSRPILLAGILVVFHDRRFRMQQALLEHIEENHKGHVFETVIPTNGRISENIQRRRPVFHKLPLETKHNLYSYVIELAYRVGLLTETEFRLRCAALQGESKMLQDIPTD